MKSFIPSLGLQIERRYTRATADVYDSFDFVKRDVSIRDTNNRPVFEQAGVEVPSSWSQTATDIVAQKFFRKTGVPLSDGGSGAETSVRQVVHRMALAWKNWGLQYGYFKSDEDAAAFYDEVVYMLLSQMAAPNSPQWFNTGLYDAYGITGSPQGHWFVDPKSLEVIPSDAAYVHPQPHACFILSVKDDLVNPGGIMDLFLREARIFKYGSGSGTNFSTLRSDREFLSGGGRSSGVLSFLKVGDAAAGAVRSGGTTRRAAKMVILDVDHPEILAFIRWKANEERKAVALINAGYDSSFEGEAYRTVSGQFSNNAVRLPDEFMKCVENNSSWSLLARTTGEVLETVGAKKLWDEIADAAWLCGDPGVQFDTTINSWNTCAADGRIRGSNPCAEYMFLDDTACNLASLNLLKFMDTATGEFDSDSFVHACRIWTIVLDLSVQMAQYPSPDVARRSFAYRTVGLGFTNLGAVIMRNGWYYDSDEARNLAGAIAALMTGAAYKTSAEMADSLGAFQRYNDNKSDLQRVIRQHFDALQQQLEKNSGPDAAASVQDNATGRLLKHAEVLWGSVLASAHGNGFRNAQVTVVAPTGTIGLLMDADTAGIEPEFALLREKRMVGGDTRLLSNRQVIPALKKLNYKDAQIDAFVDVLYRKGKDEAVQLLSLEHRPVFDCAATGDISSYGHLAMMAAVQPFISGAISKTVNLPQTATRDDVANCFWMAWKMGLKAVTIYRYGCKFSQPLTPVKMEDTAEKSADVPYCRACGYPTERAGSCFHCPNCGEAMGCS